MAYIRFLHGTPGGQHVDLYAGGRRIASNIPYGHLTEYHHIPGGTHEITLYPAGSRVRPLFRGRIVLTPGGYYTIATSGYPANIALVPISELPTAVAPGMAALRLVHLSPNAPNVDLTLPDGTVLFSNIGYNTRTGYINVSPGTYTLQVVPTGTNQVLLTVPVTLVSGQPYTVYILGMVGSSSNPLRVVVS
jgi:hypothetical protein